ncbi:MAG: Do family serine endopeptidase [Pseudomonadota bacterium]
MSADQTSHGALAPRSQDLASSAPSPLGRRVLAAVGLAGAVAVGAAGLGSTVPSSGAVAQEQGNTVVTPFPGAPASFADLVERVKGAVVSIHVTGKSRQASRPEGLFPRLPDGHPLEEFFKRFNPDQNQGRRRGQSRPSRPSLAQGSGFIISPDGYIVTNNHVIDNASKISVSVDGVEKWDAEMVGKDARTDLALLKIKNPDRQYKFVRFAKRQARVGDWVIAVGNPFGLGGTVTAGIVSAKQRDIGSGPYDYLQIDAAVNRGNSGGPTFNLQGEVVGVNTAIFSPSGGNVGIAFAVPAALATEVVGDLRDEGTVRRGWLGVRIQNVTDDIADSLGMDKAAGALITDITADGPAEKSALRVGDTIVAVNDTEIANSRDLARKVARLEPDETAAIRVLRDGGERTVDVKLGTFPGAEKVASRTTPKREKVPEEMEELGLTLLPSRLAEDEKVRGVIVTKVTPNSTAADKGIAAGDIILEVSNRKVSEPEDVEAGVRRAERQGRKAVLLRVQSGDNQRFIALPLKRG